MLELLGSMDDGVYRFEITQNILDKTKIEINKNHEIVIPLIRPQDSFVYDDIFALLEKQVDEPEYYQKPNLDLIISSTCFFLLGANIKTDFEDTYKTVEIHFNDDERKMINQILLQDYLNSKKLKVS